jgi:hypothetical protein
MPTSTNIFNSVVVSSCPAIASLPAALGCKIGKSFESAKSTSEIAFPEA